MLILVSVERFIGPLARDRDEWRRYWRPLEEIDDQRDGRQIPFWTDYASHNSKIIERDTFEGIKARICASAGTLDSLSGHKIRIQILQTELTRQGSRDNAPHLNPDHDNVRHLNPDWVNQRHLNPDI
uniref:HNHc domain-containing protein n=1 Tax=Haemonchus contortus TaxID=6289 RepID=A0A7I4Y2D4_HAECO